MMEGEALPVVLAAAGGGLAALAAREAVLASPAVASWGRGAVEPILRAGREGYAPTPAELRRLGVLGAIAALTIGYLAAGVTAGLILAAAGPMLALSTVAGRGEAYRRAVERALPEISGALADSLTGGRSLRGALAAAPDSLEGPAAVEMVRVRTELELGAATAAAVDALRSRLRSERVDAFCAALLSQQLAGGDLAALLRRFGEGAAERERVAEDARSATAQARFTGLLVVAMPTGAALFAELLQPGFLSGIASNGVSAALLGLATAMQLAGFAFIRRLSRVTG
jgi:tight adherence protein B